MELLKCLNNELKLPLANATSSGDIASLGRVQLSRSSVALGSGTAGTARPSQRPAGGSGLHRAPPAAPKPPHTMPVGQAAASAAGSASRSCLLSLGSSA